MNQPPSAKSQAGAAKAIPILRRLINEGQRGFLTAWGAFFSIVGESIIETAVIPILLALIFLSISPSPAALGEQAPTVPSDWIQRLGWVVGETEADRIRGLLFFVLLMLFAWLAKCLFGFGRSYLSQIFAQGLIQDLRQRLYNQLTRQSLTFHKSRETGDLLSRVSNDVVVLQRVLSNDLLEAARAPITILIAMVMMVSLEWRLTLFSLACVPAVSLVIARSGDRLRRLTREVQVRLGRLNSFVQERLSGIETVQIFSMEEREIERFAEINRSNYRANLRVARVVSILVPMVEFISALGMLILIYVAGYLTIKGPLSLPTLIAFAYISQRLGSKLGLLGKIWLSGQQAAAAGDRVFEILDTNESVPERLDATTMPHVLGHIAFRRVFFNYSDGEAVLRGVNIEIEAGQSVALVGASGAGKTSMVNLIPRFYDPIEGCVEIDGIDITTVTLRSLRAQIGIVPQEPILFSGTIRDNIAYSRSEATESEIVAAARAANAADFISELPQGYDTSVGERATKLSGGQRQRIAIARALLHDPRILILDEATSALDAASEALVQDALERLMQGRTTLIIAHRLSTIQRVDRILVLAEGRICEDGTHQELYQHRGIYRRLYEAQLHPQGEEAPATP